MNEQEIEKIIQSFGDLVKNYSIIKTQVKNGKEYTDIRIIFKDNSKMKAFLVNIQHKIEITLNYQPFF